MNCRGWAIVIGGSLVLIALLFVVMLYTGMFMHGD